MTDYFGYNLNQLMPLREIVFNTLRQAILKGQIKPGERLMEVHLANQLGVSRTPVREAIRMLELEGLVIMEPRKGARVAEIERQDLNDVLELRRGLEELAIQKACERITQDELGRLERAADEFSALVYTEDGEQPNLTALAEADVCFHDVIYEATHNRRLVQLLNNLREQMYRYRMEYMKDTASRKLLDQEHKQICAAIRSGDVDQARQSICAHIDNQQRAIILSLME